MNNIKSAFTNDVAMSLLIRREFFFMLTAGLMISILIAWATVGLFEASFIVRFFCASAGMVSLNIVAYIVKTLRQVKK